MEGEKVTSPYKMWSEPNKIKEGVKMSRQITRTIKSWKVEIINTIEEKKGEIISSEVVFVKPKLDKIASKRIKETGNMNFTISIDEVEQQRAISFEDFMKYSKVIDKPEKEEK